MKPRFHVYRAADGYRWRLLSGNNRTIATGEAHTRERDARRAMANVCNTCRLIHFDYRPGVVSGFPTE